MNGINTVNYEDANAKTQALYDGIKKMTGGTIPNLYAAAGNSSFALNAMLNFDNNLTGGEFSNKEKQAILLAVSQVNQCIYCLSAHTMLGKMAGFSEEETWALRTGEIEDEKLRPLTRLAREITISRGRPAAEYVDRFYEVGYNAAALTELIGFVSFKTFTNYLHLMSDVPVDWPQIKTIEEHAIVK